HSWPEWARDAAARIARDIERQRRRGARDDDRDAARVRDELARDRDRGSDVAAPDEQPLRSRIVFKLALLPFVLLLAACGGAPRIADTDSGGFDRTILPSAA